jgi:phage terminase large subunit-like protein
MSLSIAEQIQQKPKAERQNWIESLPSQLVHELKRKPWWYIGRPEQQEPEGDWLIWLILSGRGWGKTRTGGEWLAEQIINNPRAKDDAPTQWAIIAPRFADTKNVCVEGPSGFLKALEHRGLVNNEDFIYNKSSYKILFKSGQVVHMFGADSPDAGRGLNLSGGWLDELAMWPYPYETWTEGLAPALRIGDRPRVVVTTTPKPIKLLRDWTSRTDGSVHVTRGSTFDNSKNLSLTALAELKARYEGTRTGRQELYGELLDAAEGALWNRNWIEDTRITIDQLPPLYRIVVAIDPAVTSGEDSDETGIVTAGIANNGHFYVLADDTLRATPNEWGKAAIEAFRKWKADRIVAETNNGGDMVVMVLEQVDRNAPVTKVHATRGKRMRAEPISALYEQQRVHHVGAFPEMEDQMVLWTPESNDSPDRLDALVWALTELKDGAVALSSLASMAIICANCQMPNSKRAKSCEYCNSSLNGELSGSNIQHND